MILFSVDVCSADGNSVSGSQFAYSTVKQYAEQGDAGFQFILGRFYYRGEYVAKNYSKAVYWFKKAYAQGNLDAQAYLGHCYLQGLGVQTNYQKGLDLVMDAAEKGNRYALQIIQAIQEASR